MNNNITSTERNDLFRILCHEAAACRLCPRMASHSASLSRRNGTLMSKALFVGEAPGSPGAAPDNQRFNSRFEELLASIDLSFDDIFITHSVLCSTADMNPDPRPTIGEVRNCGRFLAETLRLLAPPVVVTMGAMALRAVGRLIDQPLVLAETVGTIVEYDDFLLVPLYAPSRRVLQTVRSFEQQKVDFVAVREAIAWTSMAAV